MSLLELGQRKAATQEELKKLKGELDATTNKANTNQTNIANLESRTVSLETNAAKKNQANTFTQNQKITAQLEIRKDSDAIKIGNANENNACYVEFFNGNNRRGYVGHPRSSNNSFEINNGDNEIKLVGNAINVNSKRIVNVATPTNNNDAANKKYVDDKNSITLTNITEQINNVNTTLTNEINAIKQLNTTQTNEINAIKQKNTQQDSSISGLDNRVSTNETNIRTNASNLNSYKNNPQWDGIPDSANSLTPFKYAGVRYSTTSLSGYKTGEFRLGGIDFERFRINYSGVRAAFVSCAISPFQDNTCVVGWDSYYETNPGRTSLELIVAKNANAPSNSNKRIRYGYILQPTNTPVFLNFKDNGEQ